MKKINYLILILFLSNLASSCVTPDDMAEEYEAGCIKGVVTEKIHHEWNHDFKAVRLNNNCNEKLEFLSFMGGEPKFWNYVEKGDSLIKKKNTKVIYVKRDNLVMEFVLYDF